MTRSENASNAGTFDSWSWEQTNFHADDTVDITYTDPDFVPVYTTDAIPEAELQVLCSMCGREYKKAHPKF